MRAIGLKQPGVSEAAGKRHHDLDGLAGTE